MNAIWPLSTAPAVGLALLLWGTGADAEDNTQDDGGKEHGLVLELGPAAEWPLGGERANYGGNIAVEKGVIEDWLELELGVTGLATSGRGELSTDLLFKKPFRLSPTVELMIGAGPEITQTLNGPDKGTAASAELALDLMFWPNGNVGWYVEPTWSINPRTGQNSFGMTGGLTIGFR
jgi:hypothetical protein